MAQGREKIIPGKILVKFKTAPYEQVIKAQPQLKTQGITAMQPLSLGLPGIDALNRTYNATRMRRVFPHAGNYEARHRQHGLHLWYELTIDDSFNPVEVSAQYDQDAHIERAEPAPVIAHAAEPFPDDPHYGKQWHYENTGQTGGTAGMDIRLPQAWEKTTGDPRVIVAVVDGGVDYTHEDLQANIWTNPGEIPGDGIDNDDNGFIDDMYGFNFVVDAGINTDNPPYGPGPVTPEEHGTHVAGTIAAATNNGTGVAGIAGGDGASGGARIMSCQTMDDSDKGAYIGTAIAYAADNGAVILQNSWSLTSGPSESVHEAITYFIKCAGTRDEACSAPLSGTPMKGGIVIFAAGNENTADATYPAYYDEVIAVAATNHYGRRSWYSNYGNWVDISAPGGDTVEKAAGGIASTTPQNKYMYMQGTSMACPHVSGVAALVLSRFGSETYTPIMLRKQLLKSVNPLPNEPRYQSGQMGAGLVDAFKAVSEYTPVTGVTISNNSNIRLVKGDTLTLRAEVVPGNASSKTVVWISSSSRVVAVNNGLLTAKAPGEAIITVRTEDGNHTADVRVEVYEAEHAPQGFSPNGDGVNEYFVCTLDSRDTYTLTVFDRSGQVHYRSSNYQNDWDGTANSGPHAGNKTPAGTYFYALSAQKSGNVKKGFVVIKY